MNVLKKRLSSQPIRNKVLVFGIIMSTLPLLLLSYYYYFHMKEDYEKRILEKQELTLDNLSNKIEMDLNHTFDRMQVLTALNHLENEQGAFYEFLHQTDSVEEVVVTDDKGMVQKRVSRYYLNITDKNEKWYTDQMWLDYLNHDRVYGQVQFNRYGQPVMKLAIRYIDNGKYKGIGVTIQLQKIIGQISSNYTDDQSNLYLIDQFGKVIAHQDYSKLWQKQTSLNQGQMLSVKTKLQNPKWTLVMEQPVINAYAPINNMFRNGIIAVILVTILVTLISVYAGIYFTTPILTLKKAMSKLKAGNNSTPIQIERTDELGELAMAFNDMSNEIKKQSLRLEQEKERLDIVLNGFEAGLALVTNNYKVTWMNPILNKWLTDESLDLPCYVLMNSDEEPCTDCPISCMRNNHFADKNLTKKMKDGSERIFRHRVFELNQAVEGEGEYLVVLEDITERKKIEEQMVQTDKLSALGLMASSFAHEVNNPLTTIHVYAEDLIERFDIEDQELDDEEIELYLKKIRENTVRCKNITTNLLNFSHQSRWTSTKLDLQELVQNSISLIEHQLQKKKVQMHIDLAENLPVIIGDGIKLMQVLVNLLNNAIDALGEDGFIRLMIDHNHEEVTIKVEDNGTGIPNEIISKVLDPFFTTKPVGKGTGLGLSVCYGIIQQFEGKLEIESEEGVGTTVTILLPIREKVGEK